jgi:hypothetical protein
VGGRRRFAGCATTSPVRGFTDPVSDALLRLVRGPAGQDCTCRKWGDSARTQRWWRPRKSTPPLPSSKCTILVLAAVGLRPCSRPSRNPCKYGYRRPAPNCHHRFGLRGNVADGNARPPLPVPHENRSRRPRPRGRSGRAVGPLHGPGSGSTPAGRRVKENDGASSDPSRVIGKDGQQVHNLCSDLFGWWIDANNPANYGLVLRQANVNADGGGIGGGIGFGPTPDYAGHDGFYVEVADVEAARSARPPTTPPDRPARRPARRCSAASRPPATTPPSTPSTFPSSSPAPPPRSPTAGPLRSPSAFLASPRGGFASGITMATVNGAVIVLVAAAVVALLLPAPPKDSSS